MGNARLVRAASPLGRSTWRAVSSHPLTNSEIWKFTILSMQIIYWLLIAVMVVGIIGAVVPAIPGSSLILIAIIAWGIVSSSFAAIKIPLIVTIIVLLLSVGVDFLASYVGARQAGASKWGQIGAIVGLVVGFLGLLPTLPFGGPLLGILLGPLLGAPT